MAESNSLQAGQKVGAGRFLLVNPLGRGGMGEVWLAQDERLNEPVALKFLPSEIRGDPSALDDLRRETARSHKLSHPNIVRIHDLHEDPDGTAFIVMEYIDGPTLAGLRLQQPSRVLRWEYLRPLVEQLCAALDYAHGEKVVHRDLKPANVMVDSKGRLKLADFGIAAVASDSMSRVSVKHSTSGTLPYMSPQQVTGKRPQAADDLYALGATLYELLTGKTPFYTGDLTYQILHETPEPMTERLEGLGMENEAPAEVQAMVMACLAKEPEQRPPSAGAVAQWIGLDIAPKSSGKHLAGLESPPEEAVQPIAARPRSGRNKALLAGGVLAAVLALGVAAWHFGHHRETTEAARSESRITAAPGASAPESTATDPISSAPDFKIPTDAAAKTSAGGAMKYGMYIHYGLATFRHAGESDTARIPAERFAPGSVDVRGWVSAAKKAGMTFVVLTAKHENGFCLWPTKTTYYSVAQSPYQGDILGVLIAACKAEGVLPGVHFSIPDGNVENAVRYRGAVAPDYFSVFEQQVAELHTRYPELRAQIFDISERLSASQHDALIQVVKRLNPECAVWFSGGPDYAADTVMDKSWFWSPSAPLRSAGQLFKWYQSSQAEGKAVVLNVGPDPSGHIPANQIAVLMQLKNLVANANQKAGLSPQPLDNLNGLVLYFPFTEPDKNGVVLDQSGQHNDGHVVGAKWTEAGKQGGGYLFSRSDCCIRVPNSPSLNPPQITLAAWIKTSYSDAVWRPIMDKIWKTDFSLEMVGDYERWNPPTRQRGRFCIGMDNHSKEMEFESDRRVDDGQWHQVVATYDGNTARLFLDGQAQSRTANWVGPLGQNNSDLFIGGFAAPDPKFGEVGQSFDGTIDEVMMFNHALSAGEIRQLYDSQK